MAVIKVQNWTLKSIRESAKRLNMSLLCAEDNLEKGRNFKSRKRSGRAKSTTKRDEEYIWVNSFRNRPLPFRKLQQSLIYNADNQ